MVKNQIGPQIVKNWNLKEKKKFPHSMSYLAYMPTIVLVGRMSWHVANTKLKTSKMKISKNVK